MLNNCAINQKRIQYCMLPIFKFLKNQKWKIVSLCGIQQLCSIPTAKTLVQGTITSQRAHCRGQCYLVFTCCLSQQPAKQVFQSVSHMTSRACSVQTPLPFALSKDAEFVRPAYRGLQSLSALIPPYLCFPPPLSPLLPRWPPCASLLVLDGHPGPLHCSSLFP